jgi:SAM-dependent methyltransferase
MTMRDQTRERRTAALAQAREGLSRAAGFSGWLFDVDAKHLDPPPSWDYEAVARERASGAARVLDLGTGGGERLAEILGGLTCRGVATEEWHVNAPVAAGRLRPLGVEVLHCSSLQLPLRDASFDLVLDRHEALEPAEVARVLAPGGTVVTQQCGPENWPELQQYQRGFTAAGLTITDASWHEERVAFGSLADICYMLVLAPWEIEDFDPVREVDQLIALEDACRTPDGIVLTEQRYLIVAEAR